MILLSFTVRNHGSIRDEITVDLTHHALRTLTPKDGNWADVTYPLAGIFGGNATGKSAVLDAIITCFPRFDVRNDLASIEVGTSESFPTRRDSP